MLVSVVSAVHNRADNVSRWLQSLALQTADIEVVLVDYGSTDHLASVLEKSPVEINVIHVERKDAGHFPEAYLKNVGIKRAKGDVVVSTNNDVTYEPTFFEHIAGCCAPEVLVQGMRQNAPSDAQVDIEAKIHFGDQKFISMVNDFGYNYVNAPITAGADCQAMRREHWHELRGYDEELTGWGALDSDMVCRCLLHGMSLIILGHKQARFAHQWHPVNHNQNRIDALRNHEIIMSKINNSEAIRNLNGWGEIANQKPGEVA